MISSPLVSAIIPTYNRAATIADAVDSVLRQTYRKIEVIVVDDGSSDSTLEVLRGFGDCINVVCQENKGPSEARNCGVRNSTGEIIAFLDSDDLWLPDKIRQQVEVMELGGDEMCCCVCNAETLGLNGEPEGTSFELAGFRPGIPKGEWLNPGEVIATGFLLFNQVVAIRRAAFNKVGGYKPSLRLLEDYDLAIRLSSQGSWGFICEPQVVKKNETVGIGVECQTDRLLHVEKSYVTVREILDENHALDLETRNQLTKTRKELYCCLFAERWMDEPLGFRKMLGCLIFTILRVRRSVSRRCPWWPKPIVRPFYLKGDSSRV